MEELSILYELDDYVRDHFQQAYSDSRFENLASQNGCFNLMVSKHCSVQKVVENIFVPRDLIVEVRGVNKYQGSFRTIFAVVKVEEASIVSKRPYVNRKRMSTPLRKVEYSPKPVAPCYSPVPAYSP